LSNRRDPETKQKLQDYTARSVSTAIELAIEHFNARNGSVVAELSDLRECGVVFPSINVSSGVQTTIEAMERLLLAQAEKAAAVIGPIKSDIFNVVVPSAIAAGIPLVDHFFGTNENAITTTILVSEQAAAMIAYLRQTEIPWSRLAVLCSSQTCEHLPKALQQAAGKESHIEVILDQFSNHDELGYTIRDIKKSGVRALYIDVTDWSDLVAIAAHMLKYELMGDDLLVILPPNLVQSFHPAAFYGEFEVPDGMTDFLAGSLVFGRLDGFQYRIKDKFLDAWRSRRVTKPEEFPKFPAVGASFAYDSVLAIGFGLCNQSASLTESLESLSFRGASGLMRFELSNSRQTAHRRTDDLLIGAFNIRQNRNSNALELVRISTYSKATNWAMLQGVKYVYRDGSTITPVVSERPGQGDNRIDDWALMLGILSVNTVVLIGTASICFLWNYRKVHVVRRSQPAFLCLICIGCIVTSSTTAALSHYPNYTTFFHNSMCAIVPWTFVIGQVLINSAEFAKLWRANQVTSLTRIRRTDGIFTSFVPPVLAVLPLTMWTSFDRMKWETRFYMEGDVDYCISDYFLMYAAASGSIVLTGVVMTLTYALRSRRRGVPNDFLDGESTAHAVSIQVQTLAWACLAELVGLSNQTSVTSWYLWRIFVVAVLSLSPIFVIVLPKIYKALFEHGLTEKLHLGTNVTTQNDITSERQSSAPDSLSAIEEPSLNSLLDIDPSINESLDSYFIDKAET
jgi:7 transmembrane sweet-taste receptor of 3 GCPR/Receptor family ligand binding region